MIDKKKTDHIAENLRPRQPVFPMYSLGWWIEHTWLKGHAPVAHIEKRIGELIVAVAEHFQQVGRDEVIATLGKRGEAGNLPPVQVSLDYVIPVEGEPVPVKEQARFDALEDPE